MAAHLTAADLGSDLAGSLHPTAHCCGAYGLRMGWSRPAGH
ncbi:hypothetical protein PUR34_18070 [Streptomyces sp. JV185]|nr:hypothetical protein [Streptomyces sp. JV185]MEE1770003.1 hypothetical protein [Streptomyces sp. JV185]